MPHIYRFLYRNTKTLDTMKQIRHLLLTMVTLVGLSTTGWAQCTPNTFQFPSANLTAPSLAGSVLISTCIYAGDYTVFDAMDAAETYELTADFDAGYVDVRDAGGAFVTSGALPFSFTPPSSGTYEFHYYIDAACGTATNCNETTIECTTCAPPPVSIVTCGTPLNETYCYGNNDVTSWSYQSSDGTTPLTLTFNAGGIEDPYDEVTIYDGTDNTAPVLFTGDNGGDLTGVTVTSTGANLFMEVNSDGSVSCLSGSACCTTSWDWEVECAFTGTTVTCGTPLNETYCYGNNDATTWSYQSSDGTTPLTLTFNAGGIEDPYDEVTIYDGTDNTAPVLFTGDNGGDLTGVTVTSTGANLFMEVNSDGSVSCLSGSFCCTTSWDWDVSCPSAPFTGTTVTCGTPLNETYCYGNNDATTWSYQSSDGTSPLQLTFNAGGIEAGWDEVTIYDGTDATAPVLFTGDNGGDLTGVTVTSTGANLFMEVNSDGSVSCLDGSFCCTTSWDWEVECAFTGTTVTCGTPLNETYCYGNNDATTWSYQSSDGTTPLTLTFNAGGIEDPYDEVTIYDGTDNTAPVLFTGDNGGDLTGVTVTSTGANLFMEVNSDGSVSCLSGSFCCTTSWDWDVSCPSAPFTGTTVTCGTPLNETYCYGNNDATTWSYQSSDGTSPLQLTFNAGGIEAGWDEVTIYDGTDATAPVLFTGDNGGDLTGVTVTSTGANLFMEVNSDGSVSCLDGSFCCTTSWDWDVNCLTCTAPTATFTEVDNCPTPEFFVDIDVTDLGDGAPYDVQDGGGTSVGTITATGITTVGPFPFGTPVDLTLVHNSDPVCNVTETGLNLAGCPPANDLCANAQTVNCGDNILGNTDFATSTGAPAAFCGTGTGAPGAWYEFAGTGDLVTASLCGPGTNYDTKIQVFEGSCGALTCVTGIDDACGLQSEVGFNTTPGTDYFIYVFGFGSSTGDFDLSITCTTPSPPGSNVWNGSAGDGDWNNASNWDDGVVPTCGDDVFIDNVASQPVITSTVACGDLSTATGSDVTVQITGQLDVCGNAVFGANFEALGDGEIVLTGASGGSTVDCNATARVDNVRTTSDYSLNSGTLRIGTGLSLDGGDWTNNAETVLLSDNGGTAWLDDFSGVGSYNGDITVQMYVRSTGGPLEKQHFIASPVNAPGTGEIGDDLNGPLGVGLLGADGVAVTPLPSCDVNNLAAGSNYGNLFELQEDNITFCYQERWVVRSAGGLTNGEGYSAWLRANSTAEWTGTPNTGAVSGPSLTSSGASTTYPEHYRWNLVGNPFPSPVDVTSFLTANGSVNSPSQYEPSGPFAGTYQGYAPGSNVAINQGFMVQASAAGPISFDNTMRSTGVSEWKTGETWFDSKLDIEVHGGGFADRTHVFFNEEATADFDVVYDRVKVPSDAGQPTLYTETYGEEMLNYNGRNTSDLGGEAIPLGVAPGADGSFELRFSGMESFLAGTVIYLHDTETNTYTDLRSTDVYSFEMEADDASDRFELVFEKSEDDATTGIDALAGSGIEIYSHENVVTVDLRESTYEGLSDVVIHDLLGQAVAQSTGLRAGRHSIEVNGAGGYYFVTVTQGSERYTKQVVIIR